MSEKLDDYELLRRLAPCPAPGTQFLHYKTGKMYVVLGGAIHEATLTPMIVYQPVKGDVAFCRPLAEWREVMDWELRRVERFREVMP